MSLSRSQSLARIVVAAVVLGAVAGAAWIFLRSDDRGPAAAAGASDAPPADPEPQAQEARRPEREASPAEAAPEAAPAGAAAASGRLALDVPVLTGSVRDAQGAPLAGAEVSWTSLPADLQRPGLRLAELDLARLRSLTRTTTAGDGGVFRFEEAPPEAAGAPSAVWATHERARPAWALLDPGEGPWEPLALVGELADPLEARVVDGAEAPVAGAVVEEFLLFTGAENDPSTPQGLARRGFLRERVADDAGRAATPPGSGWTVLRAHAGERVSSTWVGERTSAEEPAELVLRDTFTLSGEVRVASGEEELLEELLATALFFEGRWFREVDTWLDVRPDGRFGPARLPILPGETMRVRLSGGDAVTTDGPLREAPRAGEEVHQVLEVRRGVSLDVDVVTPGGEPIEGATVLVAARTDEGWTGTKRGATDAAGRLALRGLDAGQVGLEVGKAGFATFTFGPDDIHELPLPEGESLRVVLHPAARVSGIVTSGGEPVPSFSLLYWTSEGARDERPFEDEEGRFTVQASLGSTLTLVAHAPGLPQSEPLVLDVPEEGLEDVQLALPPARVGRGVVHDGRTGRPFAGARVQLLTSANGEAVSARDDVEVVTDASGAFELPVAPGNGAFLVSAPGYVLAVGWVPEKDTAEVDLGITVLAPECTLTIVATGLTEGSYADCVVYPPAYLSPSQLALDADGVAVFPGARPGAGTYRLRLPDGTLFEREVVLEAGVDGWLVFELGGDADLAVALAGEGEAEAARLVVTQKDELGRRASSSRAVVPGNGASEPPGARFPGLRAAPAAVEARSAEGAVLATRLVELAPGANRATLSLAGVSRLLRLVNRAGEPLASARVILTTPRGGWRQERVSDVRGLVRFGPIETDEVVAYVFPGTHAIAWDRRVRLPADPEAVPDVVVEADTRLRLRTAEEGAPVPGVQLLLLGEHLPFTDSYSYTSDGEGRVFGPKVAPGRLTLRVHHAAFWPTETTIEVPTAGPEPTVEVYHRGSLVLRARDAEGNPAAGVALTLTHAELGPLAPWLAAGRVSASDDLLHTDPAGTLRVQGLPRGRYAWHATGPAGSAEGTLRVPATGEGEVEVVLR